MKSLIKKILIENTVDEKISDSIIKSILNGLKFNFDTEEYEFVSDIIGHFSRPMVNYVNNNWKKFFEEINPEEDDDPPLFVKKGTSGKDTYEWDDVETEMFNKFIDEQINNGFINFDPNTDTYTIVTDDLNVIYKGFNIRFWMHKKMGNEIELILKDRRKYDIVIHNILNDYGIDSDDRVYNIIYAFLPIKIAEKIKSMGVDENNGMIKFNKK
jgi:hypothetical protein